MSDGWEFERRSRHLIQMLRHSASVHREFANGFPRVSPAAEEHLCRARDLDAEAARRERELGGAS